MIHLFIYIYIYINAYAYTFTYTPNNHIINMCVCACQYLPQSHITDHRVLQERRIIDHLVGGFTPSEKYELVNWDDDIPKKWKNKSHVPNHQPEFMFQSTKSHFTLWLFNVAIENGPFIDDFPS